MEKIKRYSIGFAFILFIYTPLILFYLYPHWPNSAVGWAILIFIGILLSMVLEALFEFAFSEKAGKRLSNKKFSGFRIIFALVFAIIFLEPSGYCSGTVDHMLRNILAEKKPLR